MTQLIMWLILLNNSALKFRYRLTQDNSRENLIPLCVKHHKAVEYIGLDLLKADTDYERVKLLFNTILRERQLITYMKIKGRQTVGDNQVKA